MEKRTRKYRRRMFGPEDEDARIEGIFEEEIIDNNKQCLETARKIGITYLIEHTRNNARQRRALFYSFRLRELP